MAMPLSDDQPTRIVPFVNYAIIALNVVVFFVQQSRPESFTTAFAATPYEITHNVDLDGPVVVNRGSTAQDAQGRHRLEFEDHVIQQASIPFPVFFTLQTSRFLHT